MDTKKIDLNKETGRLLKYVREKCGMTQQELARLSGYGESSISRAEQGDIIPSCRSIFILCSSMKVDAGRFYTGLWLYSHKKYETAILAYNATNTDYKQRINLKFTDKN